MKVSWSGTTLMATVETADEKTGIEYCNELSSVFIADYFGRFFTSKAEQSRNADKAAFFVEYDKLTDPEKAQVNQLIITLGNN